MTHPIRLDVALNFPVFPSEVLQDPDEVRKMARVDLQERIQERIVEEIIDFLVPQVMEEMSKL